MEEKLILCVLMRRLKSEATTVKIAEGANEHIGRTTSILVSTSYVHDPNVDFAIVTCDVD